MFSSNGRSSRRGVIRGDSDSSSNKCNTSRTVHGSEKGVPVNSVKRRDGKRI